MAGNSTKSGDRGDGEDHSFSTSANHVLRAVLRFKLLIVASIAIGGAFALVSILENTVYIAQALLQVSRASSSTLEAVTTRISGGNSGMRFGQEDAYRDKLIGHLVSRDFYEETASTVREHSHYGEILHSLRLRRSPRLQGYLERLKLAIPLAYDASESAPDLASLLMSAVTIYRDGQSGIGISATLRDRNVSVILANIMADAAVKFAIKRELREFDQARAYIDERIGVIKVNLDDLNSQIRDVNSNDNRTEWGQINQPLASIELQKEIEHARIRIQANKLQIKQLTRIKNDEDAKLLKAQLQGGSLTDEIKALRSQSEALAFRRKNLLLQGIDEASLDVQEIAEELTATNARIEALLARKQKSGKDENLPGNVRAAEDGIQRLSQENVRLETEVEATSTARTRALDSEQNLPQRRQRYSELLRQVQIQYELIAELNRQGYQFDFQRIAVQNKMRITERAYDGGVRRTPNARSTVLFGALIASMLGTGAAVFLERRNPRVTNVKDLQLFGFPVLGTVPEIKLGFLTRVIAKRKGRDSVAARRAEEAILANSIAFKYLRTHLVEGSRGKPSTTRVVSIHSAAPGEGKTFISANLAASIALSGRRTLVLDTDILGSRMAEQLGLSQGVGLVEVLRGQATVDDALVRGIRPNLDVMLAGERTGDSTELLAHGEFEKLLIELRQRYDFIVVDTAPITLLPDALLVCALADQALITVSIGQTRMQDLAQAVSTLMARGDHKVRFIANRAPSAPTHAIYRYNSYRYMVPAVDVPARKEPPIAG